MNKNKEKAISLIMITIAIIIIIIGVSIFIFDNGSKKSSGGGSIPDNPHNPNDIVYDGFTYSFLKLENDNKNLVYSPLSIKYALSMLSEGANDKTKEEIDKLIKELTLTKYSNIDNVLSLANSTFIRNSYKEYVKEEYINSLKEKYNAEVIYDEFKNAKNVNNWIEEKTFNIIKNMLSDDIVQNKEVEMLLINALAIDMEWKSEFENINTRSRPFTKIDNGKIDVAMMHKITDDKNIKYYQDTSYSVLSLPLKEYEDTSLEFDVIMPEENFKDFIENDNLSNNINDLLSKIHSVDNEELSISLPVFDFEYKTSLKEDLEKLGIVDAFSPNADFSNMSDKPLKVDDVLHKANIKVSEKGVKAAAATVIIMKDNAALITEPKEIKYLNFNKPFMFVIRDSKTDEVWFVGEVCEPTLWENVKENYEYR